MPHIHTKPGQHDHTVSAYIIRLEVGEPKIILHKHKFLGYYFQFGGHIELDETPWAALKHEVKEESGYDIGQLKILQPISRLKKLNGSDLHPYPVSYITHKINDEHFHTDVAYAFVTTELPKHKPADGESTDIKLFTKQELIKASRSIVLADVRDISLFIFNECLKNWDRLDASKL